MAPPPKRTSSRKPPARKSSGPSGNGRDPAASNGRAASNGSARAVPDDSPVADGFAEGSSVDNMAVRDSITQDGATKDGATTQDGAASDSAAKDDALTVEAATVEPAPDETVKETSAGQESSAVADRSAGVESGKAEAEASADVPAMPADDIWTPRSPRQASSTAPSSSWGPVEASERPSGNVFEVNDAFSAPPMPSETATSAGAPASSTGFSGPPGSSWSPASASPRLSASSAPSTSAARTSAAGTASSAPTEAFARPGGAVRPAPVPQPKAKVRRSTARQAHLTVARVEPWSVMKFSFAVSVVAFVILFVAVAILYAVLSALGVFDSLQHLVSSVTSSQGSSGANIRKWFSASRVLGYTVLLGGLNIVLITAMSTIGAVVYNLTSRLIGGVEVTLKETD
jgi:hypothetical protein